jgi:hypothetical protein
MRINNYSDFSLYSTLFNSLNKTSSTSSSNPLSFYPLFNQNSGVSKDYFFYDKNFNPSDVLKSASDFQDSANKLLESSESFLFYSKENVFEETVVETSVNWANVSKNTSNTPGAFNVEVSQLASSQVNEGNFLSKSGLDFETGYQSFNLSTGGKNIEISTNVSALDTNEDVFNRVANEINRKSTDVMANVVTGKNGEISIEVVSNETGKNSAFSIKDIGSGSIVEKSGIGNVSREAGNSIYSVNGVSRESSSNELIINNDLSVNVSDVGKFDVSVSRDSRTVVSNIESFISDLNSFLKSFDKNSSSLSGLTDSFVSNIMQSSNVLNAIGIEFRDGKFNITDKFYELARESDGIDSKIKPVLESFVQDVSINAASVSQVSVLSLTDLGANSMANYNFLGTQQSSFNLMGLMNQSSYMDILFGSLFNNYA